MIVTLTRTLYSYAVGGLVSVACSTCAALLWKTKRDRAIGLLNNAVSKVSKRLAPGSTQGRPRSASSEEGALVQPLNRRNSSSNITNSRKVCCAACARVLVSTRVVRATQGSFVGTSELRGVTYGACSDGCGCQRYERAASNTSSVKCAMCDHAPLRHEHASAVVNNKARRRAARKQQELHDAAE
jgi:hypothetical protein